MDRWPGTIWEGVRRRTWEHQELPSLEGKREEDLGWQVRYLGLQSMIFHAVQRTINIRLGRHWYKWESALLVFKVLTASPVRIIENKYFAVSNEEPALMTSQ